MPPSFWGGSEIQGACRMQHWPPYRQRYSPCRVQLRQQSCLHIIYVYFELSHKLYHLIDLIWNFISSPSTSKIRITVFIEGLPAPRSMSFTVARLMPAISAKSIWEIPKRPRRSLTTSLRSIKVHYNQLSAAKISKIFINSKKSLIKYTFGFRK